ncbi:hypothetical protein CHS0354_027669 [Potamilus streckersoni]|uniref:Uncharacterized protein n=1 Tax=Potamilus streckersoni TaxID=2493646 RepID=A0AAE0T0H2_9BIVA|nr:hypothetical protein CHS0354_027669 [Potamilus streckersoni]
MEVIELMPAQTLSALKCLCRTMDFSLHMRRSNFQQPQLKLLKGQDNGRESTVKKERYKVNMPRRSPIKELERPQKLPSVAVATTPPIKFEVK